MGDAPPSAEAQDHPPTPADPGIVQALEECEVDLGLRELRLRGQVVPLGARAFDLVEALIEADGRLVTKDKLISRVWPGQFVEDNTLQVHIAAIRRALGPNRAWLQTSVGRGYRLAGRWTVQPAGGHGAPVPEGPRVERQALTDSLPFAASALIGRREEVTQVTTLISAYRLTTLTGPGGIGKTSLALEVARRSAGNFVDGAHLVDLAAIAEGSVVMSRVAAALSVAMGGTEATAATLAQALQGRAMLLLLDNCEHLLEPVSQLADALIRQCPGVSILATSREPLRVEGECSFRVQPLDLPPTEAELPEELLGYGAVQLFIARATAAGLEIGAEGETIRIIAAICRILDGIPLALELAAARAATLSPDHVLSRLEDRLGLLTGGRRTALPRHQTLRAALDWSYDLLPVEEQVLLNRLSICAGGFTLDTAIAIASEDGVSGVNIVEGIANLVAKSLVIIGGGKPGGRWLLLETIRVYALEKLMASGEAREIARRHAQRFRTMLESRSSDGSRPGRLAEHGQEIDNIRSALSWAFAEGGEGAAGVALTVAFVPVWLCLSLIAECRIAVERALERPEAVLDARLRMRLNIALGLMLSYTSRPHPRTATEILSECIGVAESHGDVEAQLLALWGLSTQFVKKGDQRAGLGIARRMMAAAERSNDPADMAVANRALGTSLYYLGRLAEARLCIERALALPPTAMREEYEAWMLNNLRTQSQAILSRILLLQNQPRQAWEQARDAVAQAEAIGHKMSVCFTLRYGTCSVGLTLGDVEAAERDTATLLKVANGHKFTFWSALARCLDGMLLIRRGDLEVGVARLEAALDANSHGGFSLCYSEMLGFLAEGQMRLGRLGEASATLRAAIAWAEKTGECWYMCELFRLMGEHAVLAGEADAEEWYHRAMELAREQGAALWALRAGYGLARLRMGQGRHREAGLVLGPLLQSGLPESLDALEAQTLWAELREGGFAPELIPEDDMR